MMGLGIEIERREYGSYDLSWEFVEVAIEGELVDRVRFVVYLCKFVEKVMLYIRGVDLS
ncbi:hypothetical protein Hanom_Chr12g01135851 [Helianthus anomalus]